MPWKASTAMSQRLELVELGTAEGANIALLARRFGVSRKTANKWIARYKAGGESALADASRRPQRSPRLTDPAVAQQVVALRNRHRAWGGRKIAARLKALGVSKPPSASTITEILRRQNLLDLQKCQQNQAIRRFERPCPNDLWQMDFKGHVAMAVGGRCHPLTVLDDHSRYCMVLAACGNELGQTVQMHLIGAFRRYGLPARMLMDNGGPWSAKGQTQDLWSSFELWLMRLGIAISHGRAMHPQTQGKEERFHRTLIAELLKWESILDLAHAQKLFDPWRQVYNHERPHEGIGMMVPVARYRPSVRSYPETLPGVEYGPDDVVRKVKANRTLHFKGRTFRIGRAFVGQHVALREAREEGLWNVYYCQQRIGQLDLTSPDAHTLRACRPLAPLAGGTPEA